MVPVSYSSSLNVGVGTLALLTERDDADWGETTRLAFDVGLALLHLPTRKTRSTPNRDESVWEEGGLVFISTASLALTLIRIVFVISARWRDT